jgi:hypothetical protein
MWCPTVARIEIFDKRNSQDYVRKWLEVPLRIGFDFVKAGIFSKYGS